MSPRWAASMIRLNSRSNRSRGRHLADVRCRPGAGAVAAVRGAAGAGLAISGTAGPALANHLADDGTDQDHAERRRRPARRPLRAGGRPRAAAASRLAAAVAVPRLRRQLAPQCRQSRGSGWLRRRCRSCPAAGLRRRDRAASDRETGGRSWERKRTPVERERVGELGDAAATPAAPLPLSGLRGRPPPAVPASHRVPADGPAQSSSRPARPNGRASTASRST